MIAKSDTTGVLLGLIVAVTAAGIWITLALWEVKDELKKIREILEKT